MYDEESRRLDAFGEEVSRMLQDRAARHPDHADPIGVTRRDLKTARGRRQIRTGTTAMLAVAGIAAVAVIGAHGAPVPVKPTATTTTTAPVTASVTAQIIVQSPEWSKDVIAKLIATQKWKQTDFDAAIRANTIGLPAWSVNSTDHQFTVEGMLEPGVYTITSADTPRSVLSRMVERRKEFLASIGFEAKAAAHTCGPENRPCTPEQVLTIASIAEAEVPDPADGSRVAEAVHLRLAANDFLRVDTTALYYVGHLPSGQPPTLKEVSDPGNPYSTYAHSGLPPTPIAVTSDDMIKAALTPTAQGAYYWCTTGTGTEFFKKSQVHSFDSACDL